MLLVWTFCAVHKVFAKSVYVLPLIRLLLLFVVVLSIVCVCVWVNGHCFAYIRLLVFLTTMCTFSLVPRSCVHIAVVSVCI